MRLQEREQENRSDGTILRSFMVSVYFPFLLPGQLESARKCPSLENFNDLEYYDVHLHFGRPR